MAKSFAPHYLVRTRSLRWRTAIVVAALLAQFGSVPIAAQAQTQPVATPTPTASGANTLVAGQQLSIGGQLFSPNGKTRLIMQSDGNLVLYRTDTGAAIWSSRTYGKPATHALMQTDSNFVLYNSTTSVAYWSSGTWGHSGARLILRDDGNLVVVDASGNVIWQSNTAWNPQTLTGRAFGIQSSGLVEVSPVPDTGDASTTSASTTAPPCVTSISGQVSANAMCAQVVTSVNPATSSATASVHDATIGVLGVPAIKLGPVQASSQTTCAGSLGTTTISTITVGGVPVNTSTTPAPNTTVTLLGIDLILNEQQPAPFPDQGLTVNAVHIKVIGLLDATVASATSGISNC